VEEKGGEKESDGNKEKIQINMIAHIDGKTGRPQ